MNTNLSTSTISTIVAAAVAKALADLNTAPIETPKETPVKATRKTASKKAAPVKAAPVKAVRTIECEDCDIEVTNATWNQKRCASCAEIRQAQETSTWAERKLAKSGANHELAAWMRETAKVAARGEAWKAAMAGERSVTKLRKIAAAEGGTLVTEIAVNIEPAAPAKAPRKSRKSVKALDAEIAAADAENARKVDSLVEAGFDREDALEIVLNGSPLAV